MIPIKNKSKQIYCENILSNRDDTYEASTDAIHPFDDAVRSDSILTKNCALI